MDDIDEIRRANMRELARKHGGDAELARILAKDKNQIYQWVRTEDPKQQRTMRKTMARAIEVKLGLAKGWLDQVHASTEQRSAGEISAEFPAVRAKNDMRAMRFAIQSLFAVLHEKQPAVAQAVAQDIVETAGPQFSGQGFLNTLVGTLRGVEGMSAEAPASTQPAPASPASKRAVSGAKRS